MRRTLTAVGSLFAAGTACVYGVKRSRRISDESADSPLPASEHVSPDVSCMLNGEKSKWVTIVIGGGTSGCVAARRAADALEELGAPDSLRVLLLERGPPLDERQGSVDRWAAPSVQDWFEVYGSHGAVHRSRTLPPCEHLVKATESANAQRAPPASPLTAAAGGGLDCATSGMPLTASLDDGGGVEAYGPCVTQFADAVDHIGLGGCSMHHTSIVNGDAPKNIARVAAAAGLPPLLLRAYEQAQLSWRSIVPGAFPRERYFDDLIRTLAPRIAEGARVLGTDGMSQLALCSSRSLKEQELAAVTERPEVTPPRSNVPTAAAGRVPGDEHRALYAPGTIAYCSLDVDVDGVKAASVDLVLEDCPSVRRIDVVPLCEVDRILWAQPSGREVSSIEQHQRLRALGVVAETPLGTRIFEVANGGQVVVANGSFGAPAVLIRSGLGTQRSLVAAGVPQSHWLSTTCRYLGADHAEIAVRWAIPKVPPSRWEAPPGTREGDGIAVTSPLSAPEGPPPRAFHAPLPRGLGSLASAAAGRAVWCEDELIEVSDALAGCEGMGGSDAEDVGACNRYSALAALLRVAQGEVDAFYARDLHMAGNTRGRGSDPVGGEQCSTSLNAWSLSEESERAASPAAPIEVSSSTSAQHWPPRGGLMGWPVSMYLPLHASTGHNVSFCHVSVCGQPYDGLTITPNLALPDRESGGYEVLPVEGGWPAWLDVPTSVFSQNDSSVANSAAQGGEFPERVEVVTPDNVAALMQCNAPDLLQPRLPTTLEHRESRRDLSILRAAVRALCQLDPLLLSAGLITHRVAPAASIALDDDEALDSYIRSHVGTPFHWCCSTASLVRPDGRLCVPKGPGSTALSVAASDSIDASVPALPLARDHTACLSSRVGSEDDPGVVGCAPSHQSEQWPVFADVNTSVATENVWVTSCAALPLPPSANTHIPAEAHAARVAVNVVRAAALATDPDTGALQSTACSSSAGVKDLVSTWPVVPKGWVPKAVADAAARVAAAGDLDVVSASSNSPAPHPLREYSARRAALLEEIV